MGVSLGALALTLLLQQGPELFTVDSTEALPTVSADRTAVSAAQALRELGSAMSWRVDFATKQLEADLSLVSIDLSLAARSPRTVAQLIAAAGGADVVFDDRTGAVGPATVLHVITSPSAKTESGRQRLRRRAMGWYQAFLADELRLEPFVSQNAMQARMHLGHLLLEQGELTEAVEQFLEIHDTDQSHPYVPLALLRLAQCYQDLGKHDEAEKWATEVSRMHPSRPETAAATVLLGRNLLDQRRYDECVARMRAAILSLASTPEIVDILLIIAEAHRHRERPDYVHEQVSLLANSTNFRDLTPAQWLDYHFLRGVGAEGIGKNDEAIEALEIFLATGAGDPRRGEALVLLGRCYLAVHKYVEARAAAQQARAHETDLDHHWRKEARILQARTALALGQLDAAFEDLEREVRRDPLQTPELIVFLIESLLENGRYQKAIATADLLDTSKGKWGDRGRYLKVLAMWKQKPRSELLRTFIAQARRVIPKIGDADLQRQAVELVGQAYAALGEWDRAVDAYHGVLR